MKYKITCPPAKRLAKELNLDEETAAHLRKRIKESYHEPIGEHPSHSANAFFEEVGRIADFHSGVESLYPSRPEILYLNAGDSYSTTLIFNYKTARVTIGCWADLVKS